MEQMHKPSAAEIARARELIVDLAIGGNDEYNAAGGESKTWRAYALAEEEIKGWLFVANKGEVRYPLAHSVCSAIFRFREEMQVPPPSCLTQPTQPTND